jgi:hypothetical protein
LSRKGTSMSASLVTGCSGLCARKHRHNTYQHEHQPVTHNLVDIGIGKRASRTLLPYLYHQDYELLIYVYGGVKG